MGFISVIRPRGGGGARVDRYVATHFVSPTADGSGDGLSPSSPWTWEQAVDSAQAGNKVKILAGVREIVAGHATHNGDNPRLVFAHNGTTANPIVFFAETPANLATSESQKSILRATSGIGAIIGTGPDTFTGGDHVILDGVQLEVGGTYTSFDCGSLYTTRFSTGVKILRCKFDCGAHITPVATRNWGAIYGQETNDLEITDNEFVNQPLTGQPNNCTVMLFDSAGFAIHHNKFSGINNCFFPKGIQGGARDFLPGSFHHNLIEGVWFAWFMGRVAQLSSPGWLDVYQNIINGAQRSYMNIYADTAPRFIRFVNNTIYQLQRTGETALGGDIEFAQSYENIHWRNNILSQCSTATTVYGGGISATGLGRMTYDYNVYHACPTNIMAATNFATWRDTLGRDTNGSTSDPQFVSPGSNFRLGASSPFLSTGASPGQDYLNLLGGGTSAAINRGAYITADQSDVIGVRTS